MTADAVPTGGHSLKSLPRPSQGEVSHCARRQFEGRQSAPPTVPDKLLALADEVIE
jgi:hypothetical protein